MGEWFEGQLKDVCQSIDYGFTASASDIPEGPKFLRITDIVGSALNWEQVPFVQASEKDAEKYKLCDNDIVIARTGASTGESCYIKAPPNAVFASYLVRLSINSSNDARFISYWLKSLYFKNYLAGVLGDKSAQPNASASTMTACPIRIPKKREQQIEISTVLSALDDKIELNRRTNETLEAMAQAVFKDWFVDFGPVRRKQAGETDPAAILGGLILPATTGKVDTGSPSGVAQALSAEKATQTAALFPNTFGDNGLPEGWGETELGRLCKRQKKSLKPEQFPSETFEHFSLPAYDKGLEPTLDSGDTIKSNKTIVTKGSVLLSKLNPEMDLSRFRSAPESQLSCLSFESQGAFPS